MMGFFGKHMRRDFHIRRQLQERRIRAIWVDGPDSEAARACLPRLPMLAIPVLPTDHDADRRMDEMMRKLNAERVYQPLEVEPDCRAMWEELRGHVRDRYATEVADASAEYMEGWRDACDGIEGRMLGLAGQSAPDPTHVPAVRRVAAWKTLDALFDSPDDAYFEKAEAMVALAWLPLRRERTWAEWRAHWPDSRIKRLAAYLRHRDEKAGYR